MLTFFFSKKILKINLCFTYVLFYLLISLVYRKFTPKTVRIKKIFFQIMQCRQIAFKYTRQNEKESIFKVISVLTSRSYKYYR